MYKKESLGNLLKQLFVQKLLKQEEAAHLLRDFRYTTSNGVKHELNGFKRTRTKSRTIPLMTIAAGVQRFSPQFLFCIL